MATRVSGTARGPAAGGRGARETSQRRLYLDNLKTVLVAAIIAIHAVLSYASMEVWTYSGVREVTLAPAVEAALLVGLTPFGLFVITLLFLVAGLLAPASLARKGTGRYVRDRLLRLGVPFVGYVLLVQPAVVYALEHPLGAAPGSYWHEFLGDERVLDTGPLWFVGVLLIFSLVHAAWVQLRRPHAAGQQPGRTTVRHLLLIAVAVAPASFLIRLVYPYGSDSGLPDLNFWQWPACAALFALGITASRHGWLTSVPSPLHRVSRTVTLAATAAMAGLLLAAGALDRVDHAMGGWTWFSAGFAMIESLLAVFGPVWLLSVAQRRLAGPLRLAGPAVRRCAYGAFVVQTPVLIGLALAMRPLPLPAEVKALILLSCGVTGSFALAWLLLSRVPGIARIL